MAVLQFCRRCARLPVGGVPSPLVTLLSRVLTLSAVLTLIGLLPWLSGRDPALALLRARSSEREATPETLAAIRQHLGLDQGPLAILQQWLTRLLQGDAGDSWVSGRPVLPGMLEAAGVSLTLMFYALLVALPVTALLCLNTLRRGLRGENQRSSGLWAAALTALPEFLLSSLLLAAGAVWLRWFPPYGWHGWQYVVLPALALGIPAGGLLGRLLGDALTTTFSEPWLLTWSVAGIPARRRLAAVLRRTLPAVMPQVGLVIVGLTGGAIAVEKVFAIPGLGRATLGAAAAQDLPALQCGILILLLIAALAGIGANSLRRLLLGRAIDSGALPIPAGRIAAGRRAWLIPLGAAVLLLALVAAGLPRDALSSGFERLQPPGAGLPFGADATGRDLLARVAHGALTTSLTALAVTLGCLLIGLVIGQFPRLFSGPVEVTNAMPPVIAGMLIASLLGPTLYGAALAVLLVSWAPLAAHTAALAVETRAQTHVRIAPVLGVGRLRLLTHYIIPSLIGPVTRHAMLRLPGIALALAGLGFLGLGQQPPQPEWGRVLAEGMPYAERAVWTVLAPIGALVLLSVLAVSLGNLTRRSR
ncbi:ABC transporter permease subunit [Affinibrenneria salicis]|uniref:ABC transporter permease subunit n=1 Tax=Affinibrenneria salicis TaxID=2590031 RepID=A0A5J5G432_9GAMM|nr:ABC transporter permease subunit [Affinibrenneria salicis]KAA9001788.1 ABC transporter permease subunit [Affinibrenneria salicis]